MARILVFMLLFVWFVFFVLSCVLLNESVKQMEDKTSENFRTWASVSIVTGIFIGVTVFFILLALVRFSEFKKLF